MNNQVIEQEIKNFIANTPLNTSEDGTYHYFDKPIIGFANIHDPLFREIANHIDPEQYPTASDWLARELRHEPIVGTVIAWSLPISKHVLDTNRTEKKIPSIEWAQDDMIIACITIVVFKKMPNYLKQPILGYEKRPN